MGFVGKVPPALRPRRLPAAVLLLLLLAGCAGTSPSADSSSPHRDSVRSWGHDSLPEPFGGVSFSEDPALFVAGWTGAVAGGIAGGWLAYLALDSEAHSGSGGGDGEGYFILAGVAVGALAGVILFSLPVHGIEEFFRWLFD